MVIDKNGGKQCKMLTSDFDDEDGFCVDLSSRMIMGILLRILKISVTLIK